jgi:hypothetical protein
MVSCISIRRRQRKGSFPSNKLTGNHNKHHVPKIVLDIVMTVCNTYRGGHGNFYRYMQRYAIYINKVIDMVINKIKIES